MLGISFTEFIVILIVIFLAVGPARMAQASFHVGKWVGKLKEMAVHIRQTHLQDMDTTSFYEARTELNKSLKDLGTPSTTPTPPREENENSEF